MNTLLSLASSVQVGGNLESICLIQGDSHFLAPTKGHHSGIQFFVAGSHSICISIGIRINNGGRGGTFVVFLEKPNVCILTQDQTMTNVSIKIWCVSKCWRIGKKLLWVVGSCAGEGSGNAHGGTFERKNQTLDLGGERERSKKSLRLLNPPAWEMGSPCDSHREVRKRSWFGEKDSKCWGREWCVQSWRDVQGKWPAGWENCEPGTWEKAQPEESPHMEK